MATEIRLFYRGKNLGNVNIVLDADGIYAEITDEQIEIICNSIWG